MAEGMSGFRLGGVSKQPADIRVAFDICDPCELEITPIGLGLASKRDLQVFVTL
jgi:hypothetical protein